MPSKITEMLNWRVRRAARAIVPVKPAEYQYCDIEARSDLESDGIVNALLTRSLLRSRSSCVLVVPAAIYLPAECFLIKLSRL